MKSYWNWSAKWDAAFILGVLSMLFIASVAMYKEPFIFLIFLTVGLIIFYGYRNKYGYIEIDGDEIILKKIFRTVHLHRVEIEAYSEWNRQYGKSGSYTELMLHTSKETYTVVGGFFKNYDEIRANLISSNLQNRTQESVSKVNQQTRWVSIVFFIMAIVFSYIAFKENEKSEIDEKDLKTIKGQLSFYPEFTSSKKGKYGRAYHLVLQIKDCNRFFHIDEPLLDNLPKLPPPPAKDETKETTTKSPVDYTPFSYFNIKDSVELLYVDRHSYADLKAQVYGLKHNQTTYFWKNWTDVKSITDSKNDKIEFLVLTVLALLFGISIALGYTSKWFTGITV